MNVTDTLPRWCDDRSLYTLAEGLEVLPCLDFCACRVGKRVERFIRLDAFGGRQSQLVPARSATRGVSGDTVNYRCPFLEGAFFCVRMSEGSTRTANVPWSLVWKAFPFTVAVSSTPFKSVKGFT